MSFTAISPAEQSHMDFLPESFSAGACAKLLPVQVDLDGIPQPKPRSRAGRPKLRPEDKPVARYDLHVYSEDEEALRVLRDAGLGASTSAIIRRALRDRAAEIAARTPEQDGRLAL